MDPHVRGNWGPMAVPLEPTQRERAYSLFDRQGLLLRAIQKQTRLRNRAAPGHAGRVVHLVTTRPGAVPSDADASVRKVTVATVTQIGSHTSRPGRGAPRPPTR